MLQNSFPPWMRQFVVPLTILLLLLGVPYLLRPVARVLLAVFAGVLLAIFLDGCAALLRRIVPVPRGVALGTVIALIFLSLGALTWVGGAQVADQAAGLTERIPAAVETVRTWFEESEWVQQLFSWISGGGEGTGNVLANLGSVFSSTIEVFAHTVIIVFTGIYVAVNPAAYSAAVLRLVPAQRRRRGREVLEALGQVMRYWLVGRVVEMVVVGTLTGVGLLLIGAPLALILGVIAGLLSFIPFLGPVLSSVPAILVGLTESPRTALGVLIVFAIVQFVESNLITPLVERRAVKVPPAFVVTGQFLMAALLGFYGVLLATPLIVLFTVLVQMIYIEDVLGEPVQLLGDRGGDEG